MVATGLVRQISADYPTIHLRRTENFLWIPKESTVEYDPKGDAVYLLHEVGHALLNHDTYTQDIELLPMERAAWTYAQKNLSGKYNVPIAPQIVEDALDTYREWIHARSTCPACKLNGLQTGPHTYRCVSCNTTWRVNESKGCELRRYMTN